MTTNASINIESSGGILQRGESFVLKYSITPPVFSQFISRGADLSYEKEGDIYLYNITQEDEKVKNIITIDVKPFDKYIISTGSNYYVLEDRLRQLAISEPTIENIQEHGMVSEELNGDVEVKNDMTYLGQTYGGHLYEQKVPDFYGDLRTLRVN